MNRVLLASGSAKGSDFFANLVNTYGQYEVMLSQNGRDARSLIAKTEIDVLIVNSPLKDEFGEGLTEYATKNSSCGTIMIVKSDAEEQIILRAEAKGALVMQTPISGALFHKLFRCAYASHMRMLAMHKENRKLSKKVQDMGIIDQAKFLLIQDLGMTEPQAHRYIEKQAMDMRVARRQIAEEVLKTYR